MKAYESARAAARFRPVIVVVAVMVGTSLTAGCSSAPNAGGLDPEVPDGELAPTQVVQGPASGGTDTRTKTDSDPAGSRAAPSYGPTPAISAERRQVVTEAVVAFVRTLPTAQLVSTQVLNEAARSSAAAITVVRGGDRQVLAVSVRKVGEHWRVVHVDTLPTGQDVR